MEERFLRLKQIVGSKKDGIPPLVPVGRATWWSWVGSGKAPAAIKLGPATTVWRLSDIQAFIESAGR